jgi:signal transduction histidine kinase
MANRPMSVARAFFGEAPGWYAWAALTPVIVRLGRRWRLDQPPRLRAVGVHLLAAILAAALIALTNAGVNAVVRPSPAGFVSSARSWFLSGLAPNVVAYFGILAISHALFAAIQLRARERDAARLAAQLSEAQVSALRMQLQPHFLFNSLNAAMALIRDGASEEAIDALSQLSELLRTALRDQSHEVTLGEELSFVDRYLKIERLRFADRLQTAIDIPQPLRALSVPTFVLQPLIENAIKHGVSRRREPGTVRITANADGDSLLLSVENDGPPFEMNGSTTGLGVANTRARLERMYGARASLSIAARGDATGTIATVRLPMSAANA